MKKTFVIIFCLIIAFPIFQALVDAVPEPKIEEKRELASLPKISLSENFFNDFTNYFNDNFGLRNTMIYSNNLIDLRVFKISPNPQVIVGQKEWLYYKPSYVSNEVRIDIVAVSIMAEKIKNFQDKITKDGKKFVFVLAPNKEAIYPEFLPQRLDGEGNYGIIMRELEESGVNTFDVLKILRKEKSKGILVYSKNDTHWTRYGLFFAANEILEGLGREKMAFEGFRDVVRVGDLSLLLGLSDEEIVPEPIINDEAIVSADRVLILHDSFFDNEMYFSLIFKAFKKIHWASGPLNDVYLQNKAFGNVVILEIAERDFLKLGL